MSMKSQSTQYKPYRLVAVLAAALATGSALGQAHSYEGKPVSMGKGSAHVLVRTDANDKLTAIGVVLTPGALNDLPKVARGARTDTAYYLSMPAEPLFRSLVPASFMAPPRKKSASAMTLNLAKRNNRHPLNCCRKATLSHPEPQYPGWVSTPSTCRPANITDSPSLQPSSMVTTTGNKLFLSLWCPLTTCCQSHHSRLPLPDRAATPSLASIRVLTA